MNIKKESIKYSFFSKEPFSSQSSIFVYRNERGQYRVVEGGEQLTNTELKAQKYNTRYTLEFGSVTGQITQEFPSPVTEIKYDVKLDYQCEVIDPVLLIKSGIGEDVKGFLQEHIYNQVLQLSTECSLESLPSVKEAFPHNLDFSLIKEKGLEVQVKGELDLTGTLRNIADQQVTIDILGEFPSSDVKENFEVTASIDCKVEDLTTYLKSGITSLKEFVTKELTLQFRRLTEKYFIYQLEEAQEGFPNKINTANIRAKGIGVYITGEVDLSSAVKRKLSQQVNTKFEREYPSADTGRNFEIITTIYANIQDRKKYLKSNIPSLEQFVKDEVDIQLRRIAQQYSTKPEGLEEIRNDMNKKLDLFEFEIKGLEVNIKASVDLSEELKKSIRTHTDNVETLDRQKELKNKELEELLHLFNGTPVDYLFALYDDPKELKKYILNEHKNSMASKQALKDKYTNGDIDDIQFRRGMSILGDHVLIGNETSNRMRLEEGKAAESNNNGNSFAQSATILADNNIEDEDFN
ncbi:hypothetical protein [Mesobacillus jeotgali]|uniref:hypothetical protein n=1 Tax=Mesobacillus jeotgali TaxID=129985 RepID=UPI000C845C7B|nr:hypothetical protein [Mesobacillus jeotgali]